MGISRNTVRKYLALSEPEITQLQANTDRAKKLDDYRDCIIHLLQTYPGLSAVRVLHKLKAKVDDLSVSDRSVRRYILTLKQEISFKQLRYYEPVLDMLPGQQCQVNGVELRGVLICGQETTVYFMVFVLSYSRLMHVTVSAYPIDTEMLISQHDAAFRYFGRMPLECVYDQTKLVDISEVFRELELNQRFHQYATAVGLQIRVCEGYDPESKGKAEAGVKYVKHNALYGESFTTWSELEHYLADWLDNTANQRIHGNTGQVPLVLYKESEHPKMLTYLTPACVHTQETVVTRKADKTGLIAWCSNKYLVPMAYLGARVGVKASDGQLLISDLTSGKAIAEHSLCLDKGQIIKNNHQYRDLQLRQETLESDLQQLLGNVTLAMALCVLLKNSAPKIYKDQLMGAKQVLKAHIQTYGELFEALLTRLLDTPRLTATGLRERLKAYQPQSIGRLEESETPNKIPDLARYSALYDRSSGQGVTYGVH